MQGTWNILKYKQPLLNTFFKVNRQSTVGGRHTFDPWLIGRPETSVTNYQSMPRNIPVERRRHLHSGGSPTSPFRSLLL